MSKHLNFTAMIVAAFTALSLTSPVGAAPKMYTAYVTCKDGKEIAVQLPVGTAPNPGLCLEHGGMVVKRPDPRGAGAVEAVEGTRRPESTVDLNRADPKTLGGIRTLGQEAAIAIVKERQRAPFANAEDLAVRLCNRVSIDLTESDVQFGNVSYPRGEKPGKVGFKCVAGKGTYEVFSSKHNYVGHVTLLR